MKMVVMLNLFFIIFSYGMDMPRENEKIYHSYLDSKVVYNIEEKRVIFYDQYDNNIRSFKIVDPLTDLFKEMDRKNSHISTIIKKCEIDTKLKNDLVLLFNNLNDFCNILPFMHAEKLKNQLIYALKYLLYATTFEKNYAHNKQTTVKPSSIFNNQYDTFLLCSRHRILNTYNEAIKFNNKTFFYSTIAVVPLVSLSYMVLPDHVNLWTKSVVFTAETAPFLLFYAIKYWHMYSLSNKCLSTINTLYMQNMEQWKRIKR